MYPAALHKIPTQTVDSSQVFERWILQKQLKMINQMTKSWDRNTISDLEQVCPKQAQDFLSWLLSSKTILPRIIISSWSVICFVSSISQNECYRKKSCRVERIKLVVNTNTINTCKTYKCCIAQSPHTFALLSAQWSLVFLSETVTRADPRTVRFDKILNFRATIVIQIFYILSEKCGQQSTLFETFSKHFCIYYFYVVKDSKKLLIIQLSTTPRNTMLVTCVPCLFIRFKSLWWTTWKSL